MFAEKYIVNSWWTKYTIYKMKQFMDSHSNKTLPHLIRDSAFKRYFAVGKISVNKDQPTQVSQ